MLRTLVNTARNGFLSLALAPLIFGYAGCASAEGMNIRNGFGVDVTRIVINGDSANRTGSVVFTNNTQVNYISKNKVVDFWTREPVSSILVSPPMMLMPMGRQARVTVTVVRPDLLPKDRETLFMFESLAIPGSVKDGKRPANSVQLNFASALKVFYRPNGVTADMTDAINDLVWSRDGNRLSVENKSPLHVTLAAIYVNNKSAAEGIVVKPFSSLSLETDESASTALKVQWGGINDYGALIRAKTELE